MQIKVLLFCFLVFTGAQAQLNYGIKGGLNLSDIVMNDIIDPDAESDFNMKAGWHSGIFFSTELNATWDVTAELLFSIKGVNAVDAKINLYYVTVPLLVQYSISENFKAEAGPELGYLVIAKSKYGNVSNIYNNKLDLGLDLGLIYSATKKINFGLRLNAGISSVIDSANQPSGNKIKYQNRVLQLSATYVLGKFVLK